MKCVICRQAETTDGFTTITLEKGPLTYVVKHVPAQVCPNCGEAYVDEKTADALLTEAQAAVRHGDQVDIREYAPA